MSGEMQENGLTNSGNGFKSVGNDSSAQTTQEVVGRVSDLIKSEQLKPGDRLPAERELARLLGVSRPSLRVGLRALASMGVLKSRQGAGTFVADDTRLGIARHLEHIELTLAADGHDHHAFACMTSVVPIVVLNFGIKRLLIKADKSL